MEYTTPKDPAEIMDWTIDWSPDLETSETIATVTWTVPSGITSVIENNTTTTSTIKLSGGTGGNEYIVECVITTNQSRTYKKSIIVPVTKN